ncbi:MAG: TonB-dependent receptor [Terriglobia bacterium]
MLLAGFFTGFPAQLSAQVSTASINGVVRDASGAVIPGAALVLHNLSTGVNFNTSTNNVGEYVLLNIPPGRYALRVSNVGFQASERGNLTLTVNQASTLDFTLRVGSSTQSVNVQGAATILQTSTAELGTVVGAREVSNLQLNGRNFTQLLQLTPGASPVDVAQTFGFRAVGQYVIPAVNGSRNRSNLFLVNGINDEGSINTTYAVPPILDDIQEFKVDSHNDLVQFGGVTGGVVNVVTKSGTNHLHGVGWEYLRDSAFDARDPFFPNVQALRQNQFGANVGGPVLLPHYNGRNRTFFFGSYEGFRNHAPSQTLALVPTAAELQGDLSDLGVPIYNPFSTRPDPNKLGQYLRDPFSGGVIPQNLLDPTMVKFAQSAYPAPSATGIAGANFSATSPLVTDQNEYSVRVEEQLGTSNSFWFRYSNISQPTTSFNPIGQGSSTTNYLAHTMGVNWTHTFGPSAVMQAQFGRVYATVNSLGSVAGVPASLTGNFASTFACQFSGSRSCLLPGITLVGFTGIPGESVSDQGDSDIWSGQANFSKLRGRHLFNLGFNLATNNIGETIVNNSVGFSPFQTANLASPGNTGSAIASLLLGIPDTSGKRNASGTEHGGWVDGFYFGDQWRATDRLTVNMGIRWDFTLIPQWGQAPNRTNQAGTLNLNNGTYILQVPVPSCSQAGEAPCTWRLAMAIGVPLVGIRK